MCLYASTCERSVQGTVPMKHQMEVAVWRISQGSEPQSLVRRVMWTVDISSCPNKEWVFEEEEEEDAYSFKLTDV